EADHEFASQLGGSIHALHDGREEAVASQLQRIIVGADAAEQLDDSRSVITVYRRPQGRALLLGVHLALCSVALPDPSGGPSSRRERRRLASASPVSCAGA